VLLQVTIERALITLHVEYRPDHNPSPAVKELGDALERGPRQRRRRLLPSEEQDNAILGDVSNREGAPWLGVRS
jgi:hypothetical protein